MVSRLSRLSKEQQLLRIAVQTSEVSETSEVCTANVVKLGF